MKLILTPTDPSYGPKVAISGHYDGACIQDVIDTLVTPALIAFGFHPANIRDAYENADVPQEAPRREPELEYWETPSEPRYPELPPVPEGFTEWTFPRLTSDLNATKCVVGTMAFFHDNGEDEDWILSTSGTYGGTNTHPVYYIHAI